MTAEFIASDVICESDRLLILKMNPSMADDVFRNSLDENVRKYVPDEAFSSLEETQKAVDQIIHNYKNDDGPFVYAVIRKEDDANIGYVQLVKANERWEVGYHIADPYSNRGYATEAMNVFLDFLKGQTSLREVYGIALDDNLASRRVLEKCGFEIVYKGLGEYQGRLRRIIKAIKAL